MRMSLKYGVSAVALLAAVSFAQAQTSEREGGEKGHPAEHVQGGKEGGAAQNRGTTAGETAKKNVQENNRAQNQRDIKGQRTAKEGQNAGSQESESRENAQKEGQSNAQGREKRQRQSNAAGAARHGNAGVDEKERSGQRVNFHVSQAQKTKLHDRLVHDSAIHVYHQGEVNFAIDVGERIPDTIEFFAPPSEFVEIDPEFSGYMIVALDTEILVVDPETREIVDVIPT